MNNFFIWIKDDWRSHPVRFFAEVSAWAISISCAAVMALTVPNPPLLFLYPAWIIGCSIYAWASFNRKSFGLFANYILLTMIDLVGLTRLIF